MRKLKFREVKWFVRGHPVSTWQAEIQTQDCLSLSLWALLPPVRMGPSRFLSSSHMDSCHVSSALSGCLSPSQAPLKSNYPVRSSAQMGEGTILKALVIIKRMSGHLMWAGCI